MAPATGMAMAMAQVQHIESPVATPPTRKEPPPSVVGTMSTIGRAGLTPRPGSDPVLGVAEREHAAVGAHQVVTSDRWCGTGHDGPVRSHPWCRAGPSLRRTAE